MVMKNIDWFLGFIISLNQVTRVVGLYRSCDSVVCRLVVVFDQK